ncbi:hypothetical protein LCM23_11260 [Cytobacillus kochii]|uniref:hypothetical protein n=1 Tax=Cytobacillus kochii TaxID=859143 RepID=UPI001CD744D4|nr:hypothetical protein [Cytobacillus kochii]MCA1026670.1 hypothetical protein [Cytobacillus kochii]
MNELTVGIQSGSSGASELNLGIADVKSSVEQLSGATGTLLNGYTELQSGLANTGNVFTQMNTAATSMSLAFTQIEQSLTKYIGENPEAASDEQIQIALGTAGEAKQQVQGLIAQLESAYPQYEMAMSQFAAAN